MPTPTKVQLTGGGFQDAEGNVLANGYLEMQLSQDGSISGVGQIASGVTLTIKLDGTGNVVASPVQSVWGNDQISPANSFYRVVGFTAAGQPAWGPNNQQVLGSGGTFDVGTWVPNLILSWTPSLQPLLLQTNEVNNVDQGLLDLHAGSNITLADNGSGRVTIAASGGSGPALQIDGTPNSDQAVLNLDRTMMFGRWVDNGSGDVTLNIAEEQPNVVSCQLSSGSSPAQPNPFAIQVTNASLTSNVLTLVTAPAGSGSYPLDPQGAHLFASGFSGTFAFLNGQRLQVLTYDPFAGSMTLSVTHADVASAAQPNSLLCATFMIVISYAGAVNGNPLTPFAGPPTNTGALWISISADWSTWTAKSTNASDGNWVNVIQLVNYT